MFVTEAVTISSIEVSKKYPYIRIITFKDRLYKVVTASNELFEIGEEVLYIPDGTILPDYLLKQLGFWDYTYNHGLLKGFNQNIVGSYLYAWDREYLSSGLILKAKNGLISSFYGDFDIHAPDIDKKLKLRYITKNDIAFFKGDVFFADIMVNKSHVLDVEYLHSTLLNEPVEYEELIKGRKFYLTICRWKSHHHAMGHEMNVFLTTDTLGKYRFLSNTKANISGNIFYSSVYTQNLADKMEIILKKNPTWNQFTIGFVLRAEAYSGHFPQKSIVNKNTIAVDAYINEIPNGKFLNQNEFHSLCKTFGFKEPACYGVGVYTAEELEEYKKETNYGVVIKTDDGRWAGGAYTDKAKLNFIKPETKS